jgi:hypothetical protein
LRALGGERVHLQSPAPGAGRPVDAALPVARHVLAHAGELDPLTERPCCMLPEPVRQPAEHHLGPLLGRGGVAVQRGQVHGQVPFGQPPEVAQHHVHGADRPSAPALRGEGKAGPWPVGGRGAARFDLPARVQRPLHAALVLAFGRQVDGHQFALEGPPGAGSDPQADPRRPPLGAPGRQQQ